MARASHFNQLARRAIAGVPLLTPPRAIFRRWGAVNPIMEWETAAAPGNQSARPNASAAPAAPPLLNTAPIGNPVPARTTRVKPQRETSAPGQNPVAPPQNPRTVTASEPARPAADARPNQWENALPSPPRKAAAEVNTAAAPVHASQEQKVVSRFPAPSAAAVSRDGSALRIQDTNVTPAPPLFSRMVEAPPAPRSIADTTPLQNERASVPALMPRDRLPSAPPPALSKEPGRPVIRIGSVEVQIVTQNAAPAPPPRRTAAATPPAPLSRELISSFGLRQG